MKTKQTIKIIKRGERPVVKATPEQEVVKKTAQESARDMVATVSSWVGEFQQRRRSETAQALKTLFPETATRPTGA
jgi:hypothetical protein